jgi:hypothetical protein
MSSEPNSSDQPSTPQAAEHVAEAHRRLSILQQQLEVHPDLDAAIERLELALSILATKTGGML